MKPIILLKKLNQNYDDELAPDLIKKELFIPICIPDKIQIEIAPNEN